MDSRLVANNSPSPKSESDSELLTGRDALPSKRGRGVDDDVLALVPPPDGGWLGQVDSLIGFLWTAGGFKMLDKSWLTLLGRFSESKISEAA